MCCKRRKEGRLCHHPEAQEEEIEEIEKSGVPIWQHLTRKILKRAYQKRVWASLGHFLTEAKKEAKGTTSATSDNQEPRGACRRR